MRDGEGPPPWSWIATAFTSLGLAALGITWLFYFFGGPWDSALSSYQRELREAAVVEGVQHRVLLLGASRMMNATPSGEDLAKGLEEVGIEGVVVHKVGLQGVNLEDYTTLQGELLALEPDIIIVPVSIAIRDRSLRKGWKRQTNAFAQHLYPGSRSSVEFNLRRQEHLIVNGGQLKVPWAERDPKVVARLSQKSWQRRNKKFVYRHDGRSVALLEVLLRAQRNRGDRLVLWDLPIWFPAPEVYEERRRETLASVLERLGDIEILDLGPLSSAHFIDFIQMNQVGRVVYTERLVKYLAHGLVEGPTK